MRKVDFSWAITAGLAFICSADGVVSVKNNEHNVMQNGKSNANKDSMFSSYLRGGQRLSQQLGSILVHFLSL